MEEIAAVLSAPEVPVPTAVTKSASFSADDNGIFTFLFRLAAMGSLSSMSSPLRWQQRQQQLLRSLSWQGGKAMRGFLGGVLGGVVGGTVGVAIAGAAVSGLGAGRTLTLQGKSASISRSISPPPSPLLPLSSSVAFKALFRRAKRSILTTSATGVVLLAAVVAGWRWSWRLLKERKEQRRRARKEEAKEKGKASRSNSALRRRKLPPEFRPRGCPCCSNGAFWPGKVG